jgi:hypothetical protein
MSSQPGWAATVCAVPVQGGAGEQIERFHLQEQNRWLVETKQTLFDVDETGALRAFEGPAARSLSHVVPLGRGVSLIFAQGNHSALGGVFRADRANLKIQELTGSEALRFTIVRRLAMGGAIVGTDRGLYRVDPSGAQFQEVAAETGRVSVLEQIDESAWLIGAAAGVFRTDGRASRADRVSLIETGDVTQIQRLADGSWLFGAERGLFRADPSGRNLTALPWRKPIRVAEIKRLADGSWIVRADQGLFVTDAQARRLEALEEDSQGWRIHVSDERGALLQNKRLLYVLLPGAKKPEFVSGEPVSDVYQSHGVQDGWLLVSRRGLLRVDLPRRRMIPLKSPALGRIASIYPLKNGMWVAATDNGIFRTDQGLQGLEPVPGAGVGQVLTIRAMTDGRLLLGSARGLFRVDAEGQSATQLSPAGQTRVAALEQLADGFWLAAGRGGLVSIGPGGDVVTAVPGSPTDEPNLVIQPLANGRALLGSSRGILSTVAGLADAELTWAASGGLLGMSMANGTTVRGSLRHACAAVAESMNLVVEAVRETAGGSTAPRRIPAQVVGQTAGAADVSADLRQLEAGRWNVRLLAKAGASDVPIGKPASIVTERTFGGLLRAEWPWILLGLGAVQTAAFGGVLGLSRWRPGLLRVLRSGWGSLLIWLSFLVAHAWPLQRWALSSWFGTERSKASAEPRIDIAVRAADGSELPARDLLARLASVKRLWLQGRSGMGKSTAFAAWHGAFFAECPSLLQATRRFGFALLPIPAHLIAPGRPDNISERLIFELADAALHGGAARDPALVRDMVRKGRLALAFDTPDPTTRAALAAFARKHPAARVIVTSDNSAPEGFESWQLPPAPTAETVERLLQLWLGAYSGTRLTSQLEVEDVLPQLPTCYDLRILADLVTDDPKQVIPSERISIYRALLARAGAKDPALKDLRQLQSLAWAMTVEQRSEIRPEELAWLERASLGVLLAEGSRVLRQAAGGYAFDHEQLQFLLAAEWLVETNTTMFALLGALENSPVWMCGGGVQEALWRFVAAALAPANLPQLWRFSLEDPGRAFLQCALHKRGLETKIFPLGMASVLAGREEPPPPSRLRSVGGVRQGLLMADRGAPDATPGPAGEVGRTR